MFYHPDTVMMLANEHRKDLIAEADRFRLLKMALRTRRENAEHDLKLGNGHRERVESPARSSTGNLAACGPREAAPAR